MYASIIASAALLASSALAQSIGKAIVTNGCEYEVYVHNVPSQDGVHTEYDTTLSPGSSYSQTWTQLANNAGWSIKLSPNSSFSNIMQYEYTYQGDSIIWYDLSDVNGNPWNSNWEITASSSENTCEPKQQAYRYATDDAYGMQACPIDSQITVLLCAAESQNNGAASSASTSAAAATSTATSTLSTPTSTPTVLTSSSIQVSTSATTFATSTTQVTTTNGGSTVTNVATTVVTHVTTATATHHWHGRHARVHAA